MSCGGVVRYRGVDEDDEVVVVIQWRWYGGGIVVGEGKDRG